MPDHQVSRSKRAEINSIDLNATGAINKEALIFSVLPVVFHQ